MGTDKSLSLFFARMANFALLILQKGKGGLQKSKENLQKYQVKIIIREKAKGNMQFNKLKQSPVEKRQS